jgi:hypothetical protein
VKLLGRLLAKAVMHSSVVSRFDRDRQADELLVRLHFDESSDLFDVPWEFINVAKKNEDRPIAAEQGLGFVRVAPSEVDEAGKTGLAKSEARVLGIVIQPGEYQEWMPREWPQPGDIMSGLKTALSASSRLQLMPLENPTAYDIEDTSDRAGGPGGEPIDVVHYMGFGAIRDGTAKMAVSNDEDKVDWVEATEAFGWFAKSGARLVVAEFALPWFGSEHEPISPRTFLAALSADVNAVVFTRFPVHPTQCRRFNIPLYEALGKGESVEASVQHARRVLYTNRFLGDAAGFGWFSLVTGDKPDMRLVPPVVDDPISTGTMQEKSASDAPTERPQESQPPATFDRGGGG